MEQQRTFKVGQQVTMAGYDFTVTEVCSGALEGLYCIRNRSGEACVSGDELEVAA